MPAARRATLEGLKDRVEKRFVGKLHLGSDLLVSSDVGKTPNAVATLAGSARRPRAACGNVAAVANEEQISPAMGAGAAKDVEAEIAKARPGAKDTRLSRPQRRVLVKLATRQLSDAECRVLKGPLPEKGGVWSREDYRRIRACVQDTSGRAATCILYLLGSEEAVTLGLELDPRCPMDRRKIAFAFAVARAPGSVLGERIKLGFAMGLWSAVLADPNNPNMERRRDYRPSRRTLSSDLTWLQAHGVLSRWQVEMTVAAPCEKKLNPKYPTNRYFAPVRRSGRAMLDLCLALGDVPPALRPNPAEEWTEEDAEALASVREALLAEFGVAESEYGPSG